MINKKALVALAEGFEEMEAVISIDMLRRAGIEVITAALTDKLLVTGSRKIPVRADIAIADFPGLPDVFVLPGGMPGAENLAAAEPVNSLLAQCVRQGKIIAAICAAPACVLSPAGILNGKRATCYPGMETQFGRETTYVRDSVVVDGNIITSAGPGTAFLFAAAIIQRLCGDAAAVKVKEKALLT